MDGPLLPSSRPTDVLIYTASTSRPTPQPLARHLGAGSQCGYPNFCPAFVLCLAFVQHTSRICLHFVLVKHLSNICPKNPTFVPSKSNICPSNQTFVLDLSSDFVKIHQKLEGQNLVISWTCQFSHLESGHTPPIGCASVTVGAGVKDTISWKM